MSQRAEPAGADPWPGNAGSAGRDARTDLTGLSALPVDKVSPADRAAPPDGVDDSWMPDALEDWALDVPDEAWEDWLGPESPQPPEALPAGLLPRDRGDGAGFAAGGVADRLVPDWLSLDSPVMPGRTAWTGCLTTSSSACSGRGGG